MPRLTGPHLAFLDSSEYVVSPRNMDRVMDNVSSLRAFAEDQVATIICYEAQAEALEAVDK